MRRINGCTHSIAPIAFGVLLALPQFVHVILKVGLAIAMLVDGAETLFAPLLADKVGKARSVPCKFKNSAVLLLQNAQKS